MKEGWQTKTLDELLEKIETVNPLQSPNDEFDYIDVSSVSNTTFRIEETQRLRGKDAPSRARKLVRTNDIIFATVRPTLRRLAVVPEHLDNQVCSTGYVVLRPKAGIDHRFIFYSLFTEKFTAQMEKLQRGASYPAVTDGDVRAQTIPVPSHSEQERIVCLLDELFEGIALAKTKAEKNIGSARAIFERHLQFVFGQRDPEWKERTLKEVATSFGRGRSRHRPRNEPELYGGKYPFIQTGDIRNADHVITKYSQTYSELGLAQSKLWPKGTVCITIAANIAETGILGFDACFPDSVIGVVPNPNEAEAGFIEYLLQSFRARIQALGKGSAQANINMGTFENKRFPFPPVGEQKRIVAQLVELDAETQRLARVYERKLSALDSLKKSLLHEAFSGNL